MIGDELEKEFRAIYRLLWDRSSISLQETEESYGQSIGRIRKLVRELECQKSFAYKIAIAALKVNKVTSDLEMEFELIRSAEELWNKMMEEEV